MHLMLHQVCTCTAPNPALPRAGQLAYRHALQRSVTVPALSQSQHTCWCRLRPRLLPLCATSLLAVESLLCSSLRALELMLDRVQLLLQPSVSLGQLRYLGVLAGSRVLCCVSGCLCSQPCLVCLLELAPPLINVSIR